MKLIEQYSYAPILALQPAEMAALEELPDKDKDIILPIIPLKGWVSAKTLDKSLKRIEKAISDRIWIADIDDEYMESHKDPVDGKYPNREIFTELSHLLDPRNGYENWANFIKENENLIPILQINALNQIDAQIKHLSTLEQGIAVRFSMEQGKRISPEDFNTVVKALLENKISIVFFIFDYGDMNRLNVLESMQYADIVKRMHGLFPLASFTVSGTSFPYNFSGSYRGEIPIYERQIFEKITAACEGINLIYSDRGSARAGKMNGGNGTPPPRIDYPLKNDWRFIRKEFDDSKDKAELYQEAAIEIKRSDYWDPELYLWGTQLIERTSLGDPYGITSPSKATAVRINIHLYQQLHYHSDFSLLDTDEDWED